jgi:hypothetical protein
LVFCSGTGGGSDDALQIALADQAKRGQLTYDSIKALSDANQEELKNKNAALKPMYEDLKSTVASQQGRKAPQLQQVPKAPKYDLASGGMEFMQIATVLGALAGGLARRSSTTALNAFAGAIQGYAQGDMTVFKQKRQEWADSVQETLDNNQTKMDAYKATLMDDKLTLDQKMEMIKITATQYDDNIAYRLADMRNITMLSGLQDNQAKAMVGLQESFQRMNKTALEIEQKRRLLEGGESGPLSQQAMEKLWERRKQGDQTVFTNLRSAGPGAWNQLNNYFAKRMEEDHMDGEDLVRADQRNKGDTRYQQTAGGYAARVESAANEVEQLVPQALQASSALPRGRFVPWNELKQQWEKYQSNPQYNDFLLAVFGLRTAYTKAMNPTGNPTVQARKEIEFDNILSTAVSPDAFRTQVNRIWLEVQQAKRGTAQTRAEPPTKYDPNAPVKPLPDAAGAAGKPTTADNPLGLGL